MSINTAFTNKDAQDRQNISLSHKTSNQATRSSRWRISAIHPAHSIKAADHDRIANELQQLLDEQAQLRASRAEQNVDPDLIERIRYCVDTVIKAGEEPRQRESIRAQLQIHQSMRKLDSNDDILSERKEASQLL